jgi:hypothetical protein
MAKNDQHDPRFDKRVMERLVQKGVVKQAEVDKHLGALKDMTDQADNIADLVYGREDAKQSN